MSQDFNTGIRRVLSKLSKVDEIKVTGPVKGKVLTAAFIVGTALSACSAYENQSSSIKVSALADRPNPVEFIVSQRGLEHFGNPILDKTLILDNDPINARNASDVAQRIGETLERKAIRDGNALVVKPVDVGAAMASTVEGGAAAISLASVRATDPSQPSTEYFGAYGNLNKIADLQNFGGSLTGYIGLTQTRDYLGTSLEGDLSSPITGSKIASFAMLHEYRHSHNLYFPYRENETKVLATEIDADRAALNQYTAIFGQAEGRAMESWVVSHRALNAVNESLGMASMLVTEDPSLWYTVRGSSNHSTSLGIERLSGSQSWSNEEVQALAERSIGVIEAMTDKFIELGQGPLKPQFDQARRSLETYDPAHLERASKVQIANEERSQIKFIYAATTMIGKDETIRQNDPDMHTIARQASAGAQMLFPAIVAEVHREIPRLASPVSRVHDVEVNMNRRAEHATKLVAALAAKSQYHDNEREGGNHPPPPRRSEHLR